MPDLTWSRSPVLESKPPRLRSMAPSSMPPDHFEPCASTASLFLYAQGPVITCLHHDTLALERRFEQHEGDVCLISVDNVSERGAGRLVVSYDTAQVAIVWDLFTGSTIARFSSFEDLRVAAWMRNGNVAFGNPKGEVILFEPSSSEHISVRTIFDPITALAPAADCRTYAIGYQNGSVLIATLLPNFTILHTLTTSRGPSPMISLAWHASSSKQKSDMLASQTASGDLRVWSISKPPGKETPRAIRVLKRSDPDPTTPKWMAWSKNGKIVQFLNGETWAWDVRTKHVTHEPIPTIENPRGFACYGPTAALFTLGPQHSVQQYDLENPAMVANVQHVPVEPLSAFEEARVRAMSPRTLQDPPEIREMYGTRRTPFEPNGADVARQQRTDLKSPASTRSHTNSVSSKASSGKYRMVPFSPPSRSGNSTTTFSLTSGDTPQPSGTSFAYPSSVSMSSAKSSRAGSRLRNEVQLSPAERSLDLFPFIRARLNEVPYMQHRPLDESHLTPDDLRRQMLSVVFGWDDDIDSLIRLELSHQAFGSHGAILLARWLGESDTEQMACMIGSGPVSMSDWMLLAMSQIGGQTKANRVAETLVQKLLEMGDIHTSATILLGRGDNNDAIEVYVSRHHYMEAILLTCLLMPTDWQRQSYLVRRWGEYVVSHSQQQLAIRCFMCTGVEPSEPWTSPAAQQAASFAEMMSRRSSVTSPEPAYSESVSVMPSDPQPQPGPGDRATAKTPALKLITSFDNQPKQRFQFPGLKSDDRTPTNAPEFTPIAESAVGESALSPGGLGSYRANNNQSLNQAMGPRSNTPAYRRRRLPSIGETPIDVNPPAFSSKSSQDIAVTSDTDDSRQDETNNQQAEDPLTLLLPSARYDPDPKPSPQTAVQTAVQGTSDQFAGIKGLPSPAPGVFEALKERERTHSRTSSSDKKPDGLQIHLIQPDGSQSGQDEPEMVSSARSTASTLNSARSPSVSGRSIDQCISSVGEAKFNAKKHRDRSHGRSRRNTDDTVSQSSRRHRPRNASQEARGRHANQYIPPAEWSPSSPDQMASEEVPRCNTTSPRQVDTSKTKHHASKAGGGGSSRVRKPRSRTSSERRNNRSTSRNTASRVGHRNESAARGRSGDRQDSRVREPSSPPAISPDEGDNPRRPEDMQDALRLVTVDRERLRSNPRSGNGRLENGADPQTRMSPEPRRAGARSRSRQTPEPGSTAGQAPHNPTQPTNDTRQDGRADEFSATSTEEAQSAYPANMPLVVGLAERKRKEIAAAELEARRRSLARNPSAPNIPFPGQTPRARSPIASPPFSIRSPEQNGRFPPSKASPEYPSSSDSSSSRAGVPIGLPATPRAMRHPKYSNGYEEVPPVPNVQDGAVFTNDARHQVEETIGRSTSVPAPETQSSVPAGLPTHPRFNPHLPGSRSTSRNRNTGHRRNSSRELSGSGDYGFGSSPVAVSVEAGIENTARNKPENPPILPELQHLNMPPAPPPPPAPISTGSPRESSGTIDIAIDNENMGKLLPRAMTAGPAPTTETRPVQSPERRRMSLDHRRNRSINESFSNKIRNLTRMRSNSRGNAWGRPSESEFPYESVQVVESQI